MTTLYTEVASPLGTLLLTAEDGAQFAGAVRGRGLAHGDGVLVLLDLHGGVRPDCPSPPRAGKRLTHVIRQETSD
jgi:hypothetical protein